MDTQKTEPTNPFATALPSKKMLTLIGIYVAALVTRFISTSIFTLLPMAAQDIGGMDIYPLSSSLAGALSICAMPIYGFLGASYPALKRPLLAGSLTVGAAILAAISFAPNMPVIIAVNFFYGLVSASIFVVAYSMIRDMYGARQAGIYLGFIGTVTSIGMLVGPSLVGIIADAFSWRIAYRIAAPALLLAVGFILAGARVSRAQAAPFGQKPQIFDAVGAVSLTMFLSGVILTVSLGTSYVPFGSGGSFALVLLAAVGLAIFIVDLIKKRERAFIPTPLLKDHNTLVLALCNLFINVSQTAATFFIPAYIINILGGGGFDAALSTSIYAVPGIVICPFIGRIIARQGNARGVFTIGTILRIVITLLLLVVLTPQTPLWVIYALMLFAGFYSAQQNATFSTAPQIQISSELRFQANSIVQTAQNLGSSVGMAVYTLIMASFGLVQGMSISLTIAAIMAAIALVCGQFLSPARE